MGIKITVEVDANTVCHLAEEYEANESSFVKEFFGKILRTVSDETERIATLATEINKVNPLGVITL